MRNGLIEYHKFKILHEVCISLGKLKLVLTHTELEN